MTKARVLIAEDEPGIRTILVRLLESDGYAAAAFPDGQAALSHLVSGGNYDLVITDINMPLLSGEELLREIKARLPSVPVVIITAVPDPDTIEECFKNDAYRFLRKPFTRDQLLTVVKAALAEAASGPAQGEVRSEDGWVELTAPSRQEYLDRFQEFCDAILASRLDEKARNELKIAVQELGQNAIEWGNKLDKGTTIRVAWKLLQDRVLIRIADEGRGFDPEAIPDPTLDPIATIEKREKDGKRPGGFGIHLARRIMDQVTWNERGNVVLLEKRF
ncbi:response regulator [bacterium]|nr:response regulator [bacterium]